MLLALLAAGALHPATANAAVRCPEPAESTLRVVVERPAPQARLHGQTAVEGRLVEAPPGRYQVEADLGGLLLDRAVVAAGARWRLRFDTAAVADPRPVADLLVRACAVGPAGGPLQPTDGGRAGQVRVPVTLAGGPEPSGARPWVGVVTGVAGLVGFAVASLGRRRR